MYVAARVFLANAVALLALPSAAYVPLRLSVDVIVSPALDVQAETLPDSKPSAKSGVGAADVVTGTAAVCGDGLPDVSRARTV